MAAFFPSDLLKIIWVYAYDFCPKSDPWRDVLLVLDIQQSIPECLLRDRLPLKKFCTLPRCPIWVNHAWQLYPPNPFKQGNPYLPSACICQMNPTPWSQIGGELLRLLDKRGIRNLRTYRAVIHRKYTQHLNRNVLEWNQSFDDLFSNVELCRVENYYLHDCRWAWEFKHTVLGQLSRARFLTAESP